MRAGPTHSLSPIFLLAIIQQSRDTYVHRWTEQKSAEVKDFTTGNYVLNNTTGVRSHPYSTDPAINPLRYSSVASFDDVHQIGEVWANMLHNVYAALVDEQGFSPTAPTDPTYVALPFSDNSDPTFLTTSMPLIQRY